MATVQLREVIPVIVLVALGMLLFAAISEQWTANEEAEQDLQIEYLECRPLSDFGEVVSFSGPAELFSYKGEDWLRTTGTGPLNILTSDGSKTYTVNPAKLGLILITGQSQSCFYTNPSYYTDRYTIDPGQVFYFGTEEPTSSTRGGAATPETMGESGIVDLVADDGTLRMSQMYPTLCQDWLKESSGKRILILNTGWGGQKIAQWDIPTGRCAAWMTNATEFMKKAIEEDGNIEVEPIAAFWSQGETNHDSTVDYYYDRLKVVVERLEDGTWGYEYPLVFTSLPRYPGYDIINPAIAQMRLASEDGTFIIASSIAVAFGSDATDETRDGQHWTQEVYEWIGEALARALAEAEGYQTVSETIVFVKDIVGASLPSTVTAYGTSGASYELSVTWTETETAGTYEGELSGNPSGTAIANGLVAKAIIITQEDEDNAI